VSTIHFLVDHSDGLSGSTRALHLNFLAVKFAKISRRMLSGLFLMLLATQVFAQSATNSFEETAIGNEKSLIEAKKKDDDAFFKRALAPDFSLVGIDGQLSQGAEAAGSLGDTDLVELTPYDMKVVALGKDGAVVTYDAVVREAAQEDQGPPPRYQHFSSVWVKQDGQWKLKFHQTTAAHYGDW
jgi:hypothetical protein